MTKKLILFFAIFTTSIFAIVIVVGLTGDTHLPQTVIQDDSLPSLVINDVKLHSESFGLAGRPLVIVLHGGPGSDYRYLLPLKELADEYHVVFYDQRGAGLSQRVKVEELKLENYREELDKVLDYFRQDKEPVYLIGHSWGAMLATYYLASYGDKITKAVLAEPGFLNARQFVEFYKKTNGFQPKSPSFAMGWEVLKAFIRSTFISGPDEYAKKDFLVSSIMKSSPTESPIAGYFCQNDTRNGVLPDWRFGADSMNMFNELMTSYKADPEAFHFSLVEGIENYKGPVLLVAGSCNELIGEKVQRENLKYFSDVELKVIEGAGHTMIGEKPEQSLELIRGFLRK